MPKVLLATTNQGKLANFKHLLADVDLKIVTLNDFNKIDEPIEDGANFADNSLIKAKYYAKAFNINTIADDSGFCLDDLDGFPGLTSARFAKDYGGYRSAFTELNNRLQHLPNPCLNCHFICNLCFYNINNHKHQNFAGVINGKFTYPARGQGGFGYCPVFIPNSASQTFAEMTDDMRANYSHRAGAVKLLLAAINNGLLGNDSI
ncbi:MAG: non-canonical purine NTP pyrophosphatase [Pseudomonadota bacterium]